MSDFTPLYLAVLIGELKIVKVLFANQKTDPNIPNDYGKTPLQLARELQLTREFDRTEIIELLEKVIAERKRTPEKAIAKRKRKALEEEFSESYTSDEFEQID